MATITIRRLDERIKASLRLRAARHGRSMEEEAREILKACLVAEPVATPNLADSIRRRIAKAGWLDLQLAPREPIRRPPKLGR